MWPVRVRPYRHGQADRHGFGAEAVGLGTVLALGDRQPHHFADGRHLDDLYDAEHPADIHVDNGRSGTGPTEFDPGSITQVQAVQAIATYVWGRPTEITGRWERGPGRRPAPS